MCRHLCAASHLADDQESTGAVTRSQAPGVAVEATGPATVRCSGGLCMTCVVPATSRFKSRCPLARRNGSRSAPASGCLLMAVASMAGNGCTHKKNGSRSKDRATPTPSAVATRKKDRDARKHPSCRSHASRAGSGRALHPQHMTPAPPRLGTVRAGIRLRFVCGACKADLMGRNWTARVLQGALLSAL